MDKVVAVTSDNASNMTVAAAQMNLMKIGCFAHTLNLAAGKLYNLSTMKSWLAKLRSIVVWFKRVHLAKVVLQEMQPKLGIPSHSLILDVRTRWNSLYQMVDRFTEQYPALVASSADPRLKKSLEKERLTRLTDDDIRKAEEFTNVMGILYTCTEAVSSEKNPTIGQIIPTLQKLKTHLTVNEEDSPFKREIKNVVWENLKTRYQNPDVSAFLEEATCMDPRFKSKITNEEVWLRVEAKLVSLCPSFVKVKEEHDAPQPSPKRVKTEQPKSALELMFGDEEEEDNDVILTEMFAPPSPTERARRELAEYKAIKSIPLRTDPLLFWKVNESRFPVLVSLVKQYLCVQASSVSSERVFSTAGDTLSRGYSPLLEIPSLMRDPK